MVRIVASVHLKVTKMDLYKNANNVDVESFPVYDEGTELGSIFCLTRGDITKLKADAYAISNSASKSCNKNLTLTKKHFQIGAV